MDRFDEAYQQLNDTQRQAVDTTEGPLLVVAGPGTGKTQLLSVRVANILKKTGVEPANILCLTFTDNAARNMRDRLESIIGQAAYHVAIHTFHSFGSDIISQYPDYFTDRHMLQQIDELGSYEILRSIFDKLPHSNPFSSKIGDNEYVFLKDALSTVGWLKQNAVSPEELHALVQANQAFIEAISKSVATAFAQTPSTKHLNQYRALLKEASQLDKSKYFFGFPELASLFVSELAEALDKTDPNGRYAQPITAWRNRWCQKDASGQHVLKDGGRNIRKLHALANIYRELLAEMQKRGVYDFDDMIVEAVHALENNDELRLTLQERYQYILVDEFQDTNKAQLRMLVSLGDNTVNEGRPNIMTVGDDDQAIYAFQGAEVSNMVAFSHLYSQPTVITLNSNYRSTANILNASYAVAGQITDRLENLLPKARKTLQAVAEHPMSNLRHNVFISELAQYDWIADKIKELVKSGVQPQDIAVIAPRHRYLERLVPYLGNRSLPVAYERRENILDAPVIKQLLTMAALVVALADNKQSEVDRLMGEVLGFEFWDIPTEKLIDLSLAAYNQHATWLSLLQKHSDEQLQTITKWFVGLARRSATEPLEYMIDQLMGVLPDGVDAEFDIIELIKKKTGFISPLRNYYFNTERFENATDIYLAVLGQLASLRQKLRQWKPETTLYIRDAVEFVELNRQANLKIIDENPHTQTTNAVQVMTAYKAKGLEFGTVFVINAQDEIWGPTARSAVKRIPLPKNLPLAPASDGENDKLRLLFVSLTRAKHSLYITSYTNDLNNKLSPGLSFIGGNRSDAVPTHPAFKPHFVDKPDTLRAREILTTDWAYRFRQILATKASLFEPILANYRLSVTHLNNFIDVRDAGPQYFLVHNLLRFPEALTPSAAYGDAIHKTLQWLYIHLRQNGRLPSFKLYDDYFVDVLSRKHLRPVDFNRLRQRGEATLKYYVQQRGNYFQTKDLIERGFNNEGVLIGNARLSGKVDKIHFLANGGVSVIDFKTGHPATGWQGREEYEKVKLHKYRQQLLFYKLLVEKSASYKGKLHVSNGALEFVEPADNGELVDNLEIEFDNQELARFERLIVAVWQHIMALNFPDTSGYSKDLKGVLAFEEDLLNGQQ